MTEELKPLVRIDVEGEYDTILKGLKYLKELGLKIEPVIIDDLGVK